MLNKVHAYDPGSNSWRRVPDLPEGRHGMGAVTVGNRIYVPGGGFQNGIGPSARVFAFIVTQPDPLPFEQWARGFFSSGDPDSGPDDDFDGDGLANVEEFALNRDPGCVVMSQTSSFWISSGGAGGLCNGSCLSVQGCLSGTWPSL